MPPVAAATVMDAVTFWPLRKSVIVSVEVPAGSYSGCLKTEEHTPLESNSTEFKYYCDGVGTVLETNGSGGQRDELQGVTGP